MTTTFIKGDPDAPEPQPGTTLVFDEGKSAYVPGAAPGGGSGGDGSWTSALEGHVESATPHPAYDDIQSLSLLFKNRLV